MTNEMTLPVNVEMLVDAETDMSKLVEVIKTGTRIDTGRWFF